MRHRSRTALAPGSRVAIPPRLETAAFYVGLTLTSTLLASWFLGLLNRPFDVPLAYEGDALAGGSQVKGVIENGWYERNPLLGAPFGQNMHDFPVADNLQFVLFGVFGLFSDNWAVIYNLSFLLTFPAAAVAAAWFFRVIGVSRLTSFGFALLYAFTPYHFEHGQPHLALSMYFVVPLFAALLMDAQSGRPLWARRPGTSSRNPVGWVTPRTAGTLSIVVLLGTTSSYYSVFGLLLAVVVVAVSALKRRWRAALGLAAAMAALVAVMILNMAPDILHARSVPNSPAEFSRSAVDSEIYALKFAQLVFPAPWHPVRALAEFRATYDSTFPNPAEHPALGIVATVGFVLLLAAPFVAAVRRRALPENGAFGRTQQDLSLLTFVAFLFGTAGGLGTLFAVAVSPDIRAWNRIITYLALFALAACALLTDVLLDRLKRHSTMAERPQRAGGRRLTALAHPAPVLPIMLVTFLVAVGLADAVAPPSRNTSSTAVEDWRNDEEYVHAVEAAVPAGTMVFELPYLSFPEADPGAFSDMRPYDPIRPYLHSSTLSWSYGGLAGRPRADWQKPIAELPARRLSVALAASGFGGVHIDRFGYPDHDSARIESALRNMVGPPVVSPDDRFAFYDLTPLKRDVAENYSAAEIAEIARHTLRPAILYSQPGFTGPPTPDVGGDLYLDGASARPEAVLHNSGAPLRLRLRFTLYTVAHDYPTTVEVTWPDGYSQSLKVDEDGTAVSRTFTVPPGQHTLAFDAPAATQVRLRQWVLRDPGLGFPLRGRAAAPAGADPRDSEQATAAQLSGMSEGRSRA